MAIIKQGDFVQSIAVIVGLAILLVAVAGANGGIPAFGELIDPARLDFFSTGEGGLIATLEDWAVPVCGSLLAVELLTRILGCRSASVG